MISVIIFVMPENLYVTEIAHRHAMPTYLQSHWTKCILCFYHSDDKKATCLNILLSVTIEMTEISPAKTIIMHASC